MNSHAGDYPESQPCPVCKAPLPIVETVTPRPAALGGGVTVTPTIGGCEACAAKRAVLTADEMTRRKFEGRRLVSGIPTPGWGFSLDPKIWDTHRLKLDEHNRSAVEAVQAWVTADNSGLLVYGAEGRGKSLIGVCGALDCIRRGQDVLWVAERDLIDSYRKPARGHDDARDVARAARTIEVLVIDDIGRHQIDRGTAYLREMYIDLFDSRLPIFGDPLKTLLTSQHSPDSLARWCTDDALSSRVLAVVGGNDVALTGDDRRRTKWAVGGGR